MEPRGPRQRITVELSEEAMEIVQQRVAESGCADASEYLDNLVLADLTREQKQHLERLLVESIESGPSLPMDDAYWVDLHKRVQARIAAKGRSAA